MHQRAHHPHHRHQRVEHRSRSTSHHDSPPRHHAPHDPQYEYHQPYSATSALRHPCPHCHAPPATHHADAASSDLVCTRCGAVLDDRLRDEGAEWRDYDRLTGEDAGGRGRARAGADAVVDEARWVGGLAPSAVSAGVFRSGGRTGRGGAGFGEDVLAAEDRRRLALARQRLRRTHNVIQNLVEQEERRARDAKRDRGEDADGSDEDAEGGGIAVEGDYEGLLGRRRRHLDRGPATPAKPAKGHAVRRASAPTAQERAFASLRDRKWSLVDALVLHGTLEQVRAWAGAAAPDGDGASWTDASLEAARGALVQKRDAAARAAARRLHRAFALLEGAARQLDLGGGPGSRSLRVAVGWLLRFAAANDGLRIKGITSGGAALRLSLLGPHAWLRAGGPSGSSLAAELHRTRQYAALGAALLYLAAKHAGLGRTLTEVCAAFGTYRTMDSPEGSGERGAGEPLTGPKHCSRAMQVLTTETTNESLKCFNLERNIEADLNGVERPPELTIDDLLE